MAKIGLDDLVNIVGTVSKLTGSSKSKDDDTEKTTAKSTKSTKSTSTKSTAAKSTTAKSTTAKSTSTKTTAAKSTAKKTTKAADGTSETSESGFDLGSLAGLALSLAGGSSSIKKVTKAEDNKMESAGDIIKMLAKTMKKDDEDDTSLTKNAAGIFKTLMSTKSEDEDDVDTKQVSSELDILKKILPATLTKSNTTTLVQKAIASLTGKKQTVSGVMSKLEGFDGLDLDMVQTIATKLLSSK